MPDFDENLLFLCMKKAVDVHKWGPRHFGGFEEVKVKPVHQSIINISVKELHLFFQTHSRSLTWSQNSTTEVIRTRPQGTPQSRPAIKQLALKAGAWQQTFQLQRKVFLSKYKQGWSSSPKTDLTLATATVHHSYLACIRYIWLLCPSFSSTITTVHPHLSSFNSRYIIGWQYTTLGV